MAVMVGAVALFVAVFLVGLVGPALPAESPGARSSEIPFTAAAERGHQIYASAGCASCHTQLVRPVVADVGLGAVTLNDSNQVLGTRRFGPDLSDAGSRLSASQIEALITGTGNHPALSLSQDHLDDLTAYLLESKTSAETPAPAAPPSDEAPPTTVGNPAP
jgi:mono/diheme cytochrome c family protein